MRSCSFVVIDHFHLQLKLRVVVGSNFIGFVSFVIKALLHPFVHRLVNEASATDTVNTWVRFPIESCEIS